MRYDGLMQKLETPVEICPYLCLDNYVSSDCLPPPMYLKFSNSYNDTKNFSSSPPISMGPKNVSVAVQTDIEPQDIINPDTPETDNEETALKVFF